MPVNVVFRKTSFVEYPALVSAVLFFYRCNLRCPWCHNRELVRDWESPKDGFPNPPDINAGSTDLEKALQHIEKRRNVLGGLVLSGGEPTLFPGLAELIPRIKALGLRVKIDTNGMLPDVLEKLFATPETRPDYVAMDLKIAPERYRELLPGKASGDEPPTVPATGPAVVPAANIDADLAADPGERLRRSAVLIRASGIAHEFRSLALPPPYFGKTDLEALAPLAGSSPWRIRPFVPGNCLDSAWDDGTAPMS
jgi:pyruvate formate lyase activating enzyme